MAQLSPKDFEYLSAYLDGQVSARQRAAVEKRLQTDPEARQALAELRQVRSLMGVLQPRKVPHAFTLTRSMAQEQRLPRGIPLLRFSSILAALLMAFLFVFQSGRVLSTAMAPASAPVAETYQTAGDASASQPAEQPIIIWNQGGSGGGMGGVPQGMGGDSADTYTLMAPQPTPAPKEMNPAPTPTPAGGETTREVIQPTAAPLQAPAPGENAAEGTILGINPQQAGEQLYSEGSAPAQPGQKSPLNAVTWAQIALGAAALGLGAASILLTRRFRRG